MIRPQRRDVEQVGQVTYQFEKLKGIFSDPKLPSKQMQCPEWRHDDKARSGQNSQNDFFEGDWKTILTVVESSSPRDQTYM